MSDFPGGHALLVGAGGDLPQTANDAEDLGKALSSVGGYLPEQVKVKPNGTRDDLLGELNALAAERRDTVFFYFSGHGNERVAGDRAQYFLQPHGYDATRHAETAVTSEELCAALDAIKCDR